MTHISTAISTLVSEYDRLEGIITPLATGRRGMAMERITGMLFRDLAAAADPEDLNHLGGRWAERTLSCAEFLSGLMVAAMLDFRQKAARHG
ncbi:hypothetical protein [Arthrobacter flavus]|uniref:Uncharacterized protein n=1 Tax=Arthrobacter flavus TaxID=95172 RepID=A0ABW4Q318_9MICC